MGYLTDKGEFVDAVSLNANALQGTTITADGYSAVFEMGHRRNVTALLTVTSVSASDALDVTIQSTDDGTNYYTVATFTQATGATSERKAFVCGRKLRALFDVTGSSISIVATLALEAV